MAVRITQMELTDSGVYNESGDLCPDMLNGGEMPSTAEAAWICWLSDVGYEKTEGFRGRGMVLRHRETGELISVSTTARREE